MLSRQIGNLHVLADAFKAMTRRTAGNEFRRLGRRRLRLALTRKADREQNSGEGAAGGKQASGFADNHYGISTVARAAWSGARRLLVKFIRSRVMSLFEM